MDNVAGYLIEGRRRWPVIYCFLTRTIIFYINSKFEKKGIFGSENHTSCLVGLLWCPGQGSNSRPPVFYRFNMAKVTHTVKLSHGGGSTCASVSVSYHPSSVESLDGVVVLLLQLIVVEAGQPLIGQFILHRTHRITSSLERAGRIWKRIDVTTYQYYTVCDH